MTVVIARIESELLGQTIGGRWGDPVVTGVGLLFDDRGRPYIEVRTDGGDTERVRSFVAERYRIDRTAVRTVAAAPTKLLRGEVATGAGVGHYLCSCIGTLGLFIRQGRRVFALSNRHVLASNGLRSIGDAVVDRRGMRIGTVAYVAPFGTAEENVDLALARLDTDTIARASSYVLPGTPRVHDLVIKTGARTGRTVGIIRSVRYSLMVEVEGVQRTFLRQIAVEGIRAAFSQPGDSGSLVAWSHDPREAMGILFAGDTGVAGTSKLSFLNPWTQVVEVLRRDWWLIP